MAAVASCLEARAHNGRWLVRVEDIDPPREQAGATHRILAALEAFGFEWNGEVGFQSERRDAHDQAVKTLADAGHTYPCGCSRRDLSGQPVTELGIRYPGTCRNGTTASETATRVLTSDDPITFQDRLQGEQTAHLESESGDFVVLRKDGLIAYQLAVVVDDHLDGITDIVRGIDLMPSTPRQIYLQRLLGLPTPEYAHLPVATNNRGQKLSKSYGAAEILVEQAPETLHLALVCLQQNPPDALKTAGIPAIWAWARGHWDLTRLHGVETVPVGHLPLARAEISQSDSD